MELKIVCDEQSLPEQQVLLGLCNFQGLLFEGGRGGDLIVNLVELCKLWSFMTKEIRSGLLTVLFSTSVYHL